MIRNSLFTSLFFSLVGLAHGAIGIDASVSADRSSASKTVVSTAFSTTSANELLLAFVASDSGSGPMSP